VTVDTQPGVAMGTVGYMSPDTLVQIRILSRMSIWQTEGGCGGWQ
jgi:hypothetical protein